MKFAGVIYSSTPSYLSLVVILAGALGAATVYTQAQSGPSPGAYNVTARTMDSRTWTRTVITTDPVSGIVTSVPQSYQEVGNGVCYQSANGVFLDSQDLIDLTDSGAEATHGPMPAAFSGDIADATPITLFPPVTASGPSSPLKLAPIGLFYKMTRLRPARWPKSA